MRASLLLVPILLANGCGAAAPTLAGGKPVGHWVEALRDADPEVRKKAVFKLGNVGAADAAVLPALRQALQDPDARVRSEAIRALVKCGPQAKAIATALTELGQKDPDLRVRDHAAKALEKLQADP